MILFSIIFLYSQIICYLKISVKLYGIYYYVISIRVIFEYNLVRDICIFQEFCFKQLSKIHLNQLLIYLVESFEIYTFQLYFEY